jgi:flagellar protein FliS
MNNEATLAYRQNEITTTDGVGLVLVLYDMLLRDLRTAITALEAADIEARAAAIRHSLLVLQQLQGTLDMDRGGVVAQNLDRFYNFIRAKLLDGQIKASAAIFREQVTFVASIREAWEQVRQDQLSSNMSQEAEVVLAPPPVSDITGAGAAQWSA